MKASTLFAITISVMLALGLALGAKALGVFNGYQHNDKPTLVAALPTTSILVSKMPLPEGIMITPEMVEVRELRPGIETEEYRKAETQYLAPNPASVIRSIARRNIPAGQPLKIADFDSTIPDGYAKRLRNGMVGVHINIPAEHAAGGLIQNNEPVNVLFTAKMGAGNNFENAEERTGVLARDCRVIMKRDSLFNELKPVTPLIAYTIETNPYRAALIEYANRHGDIYLQPVSNPDKGSARRYAVYSENASLPPAAVPDATELKKIDQVMNGTMTIGPRELAEALHLGAPPFRPEGWMVNNIVGISPVTSTKFPPPRNPNSAENGWQFAATTSPVGLGLGAGTASNTSTGSNGFGPSIAKNPATSGGPISSTTSTNPDDCPTCPKQPLNQKPPLYLQNGKK